jgi:imidazolonepropionase-like amidohydrolase
MPDLNLNRRTLLALISAGVIAPRRLFAAESLGTGADFTLSNATVLLHTGERIAGAGVRVEGGRFVAIGPEVTGGQDMGGAWLVPGFCDAGCRLGLMEIGAEGDTHDLSAGKNMSPNARAIDGYNPRSELIPIARVNGITTVLVHPSLSGLVAGQAALMRTVGDTLESATIDPRVGLCVQTARAGQGGEDGPKSRVGVSLKLREVMAEIGDTKRKKKDDKSDIDGPNAKQTMQDFKAGELLALVKVERADDIERALDFIASHSLNAALVGCAEAHLLAPAIAAAEVPVILGPLDVQPNSFQHPHARYENAAILHKAGVKLAFRTGATHGVRTLPTLAGLAVSHGLPFEAAIQALTVNPMEILGQPDMGRIAVDAEATFFAVAGDPLQPKNPVQQVWIQGDRTSMETRQTRLYEAFKSLD